MKFATTAAFLALALSVKAQDPTLQIDTPPAVQQCAPVQLTFRGPNPPFTIDVLPQGQISAPPIATVGSGITGTSVTWNANVQQSTGITIRIRNAAGVAAFSAPVQIQPNSDSSCLNGGASSSGSASSGASSGSSTNAPTSSARSSSTSSSSGPASVPSVPGAPSTSPAGASPTTRPTASGGSSAGSASSTGAAPSGSQTGTGAAASLRVGAATGLFGLVAAVALA